MMMASLWLDGVVFLKENDGFSHLLKGNTTQDDALQQPQHQYDPVPTASRTVSSSIVNLFCLRPFECAVFVRLVVARSAVLYLRIQSEDCQW